MKIKKFIKYKPQNGMWNRGHKTGSYYFEDKENRFQGQHLEIHNNEIFFYNCKNDMQHGLNIEIKL